MKKSLCVILSLAMAVSFAACAGTASSSSSAASVAASSTASSTAESTPASAAETAVMTYDEYAAAAVDTEVVVETYVQAKQGWWDGKATIYTQDENGAYFIYDMPCTEEEYAKMTQGAKMRVTGYKSEWSGEVEIIDATFEMLDGEFVATPFDATALLGTDELIAHQNQLVSFNDMEVAASKDAEGKEVAYLYNWDGSGEEGSDLYFNVTSNGETYSFVVESYLCDSSTDVYKAVKELNVGDKIDCEGFLYWYEGANPHITSVTVK